MLFVISLCEFCVIYADVSCVLSRVLLGMLFSVAFFWWYFLFLMRHVVDILDPLSVNQYLLVFTIITLFWSPVIPLTKQHLHLCL